MHGELMVTILVDANLTPGTRDDPGHNPVEAELTIIEASLMQPKISPWAFVLAVPDLDKSAAYFRDVLGFRVLWGDTTDWRLVQRDSVRVMLGHCPNDMPPSDLGSHNWFGYLRGRMPCMPRSRRAAPPAQNR